MKRISLSLPALLLPALLFPALALAATCPTCPTDPLNSYYMPVINESTAAYPSNIWITGPLAKVRQDDITTTSGTTHWAIIYTAQNEFQSFQVHVHASASISNLNVTMSNLTNVQTGTVISAASTNIIVYREAYIDITNITAVTGNTFYGVTGHYPDILIPAVDPYWNQTTNAFPFNVASGNNQSAWIDVHIPPSALSGYYSGTVTVLGNGVTLSTMPVVYAVWAWQMPSTATLQSYIGIDFAAMCTQAYGGYSGCSAYPGATSDDNGVTLSQIDEAVMMLDHRQTMTAEVYPPLSSPPSFSNFETNYGPLLNGTPAHTQTILSGAKVTTLSPYTNGATPTDVQNWMTEFSTNISTKNWESTIFDYSCDEPPNGCAWSTINSHASTLHSATPPMPALVTTNIAAATSNGVANSIDWMVPLINDMDQQPGYSNCPASSQSSCLQQSTYAAWLSGAPSTGPPRQLWSYQSCRSSGACSNGAPGSGETYPNYDIDGTPVANRAMEWLTYLHSQAGELYYDGTYCWTSSCGPSGATTNPWASVYYSGGNGDGTLIYPGIGTGPYSIGVTKPIFLPSIRLKMKRDGFQDYEYLHALAAAGQSTLVSNEISSWITNSYTFNNSTGATAGTLTAARQALGTALHQLTYPPGNAEPPTLLPFSGVTFSAIQLNWDTDGPGVFYNVLTSTAPNPLVPAGAVVTTSSTYNTYLSTSGLNPSVTYYFLIDASTTNFTSGYTSTGTPTLAVVPFNVTFASVSSSTLTAQWLSQDGIGTRYEAVIAANASFAPALSTVTVGGTSASFANLSPSTTYWVEVAAKGNAGDTTNFSASAATITLLGAPGAGSPAFIPGNASLAVQWTNGGNNGTLQYQVEISSIDDFVDAWAFVSSITFNTSVLFGTSGLGNPLAANTSYYAQVQILNNGSGQFSPFTLLGQGSTFAVAPNTPAIVSLSSFSILAQWTSADGPVASFEAVISVNPGFAPALSTVTVEGSLQANGTESGTASFGGLAFGTTYYVEALARGNNGDVTAPSTIASGTTLLIPPGVASPAFLSVSTNTLAVQWTNGGNSGSLEYQAEISTNANFNTFWVGGASLTYNTSAVFGALGQGAALNPNTTYYAQVQIVNNGLGNNSAFVVLGATATLANPPQGTAVIGVSTASATLTWNNNGNSPNSNFQVFADTSSTFGEAAITTVSTVPAIISNLLANTTYFFKVRAVNWNNIVSTFDVMVTTQTDLANTVVIVGAGSATVQFPPSGTPSIELFIPAGSFSSNVQITLGNTPTFTPGNNVGSNIQKLTPTGTYVEVTLLPAFEPTNDVTLVMSYNPATILTLGISPSTLVLALYNPAENVWVPLVTTVDTGNETLTAQTGHLSLFQIMGAAASTSVSSVVIYPNPLRPSLGPGYNVMNFAGLPFETTLRIYTITGHLVKELGANASGMAQWDGTNESGEPVASGAYFVYAQGNGTTQTFKVAVQR